MMQKLMKVITALLAAAMIGVILFLKWPKASISSKKAAIEVSAQEIYDTYSTNEVQADGLYKDKVVAVSGVINDLFEDENGAPVMILEGTDQEPTVLITFEKKQANKILSLDIGENAKVKGVCTGMLMEVTLKNGILL